MNKLHALLLLSILMILVMAPTAMMAAPAQLSNTAKSKLEKVITSGNSQTASSLKLLYSTLLKSQDQEQQWEEKIKAIHYKNEEGLIRVRKQIQLIDDDKLSRLASKVEQTKARYQSLFDSYTLLNKQIKVAKLLKNKQLNTLLQTQADVMKIATQLARQDIRNKENEYKTAKDFKAKTVKRLRAELSNIDPLKVKIKSEKSRMSKTKQRFTSEWKTLNAAITKGDAKSIMKALTSLDLISKQVNEHKLKIHEYENSISTIMHKVQVQIP